MRRPRRYEASVECCPACLWGLGDDNPECPVCGPAGDDFRAIEITAVGTGYTPATRGSFCCAPEHARPPEGAEFGTLDVSRSDGVAVGWDGIPVRTHAALLEALIDVAESDDSAQCADEDRADAARDMEDSR